MYPLIGPYNSTDPLVVDYHLKTALAAGIQGLVVDWYGPDTFEDKRVPLLLEKAAGLGMRIALCYEEKVNYPPYRERMPRPELLSNVVAHLSYIVREYAGHPAYMRRNGKPFLALFNYWRNGRGLTPEDWEEVLHRIPKRVAFSQLGIDAPYHPTIPGAFNWWWFEEGRMERLGEQAQAMIDAGQLEFFVDAICPGFDDSGVNGWGNGPRRADRNGLGILRRTFDLAFAKKTEIVQIVTWNDFEEGTVVEPTREDGFLYLDALETWWSQRTGRPVNLADNRAPFLEYRKACSKEQAAELPPGAVDEYLSEKLSRPAR